MPIHAWTIEGSDGLELLGDTHEPADTPLACAIIVHGYKGYKDYGMFPLTCEHLARAGVVAHRFNLAHSGMTNETATFARPDLFEQDTWAHQVADLRAVVDAIRAGRLAGAGLPLFLVGHSRGGVTVLLAAAWHAGELGLAGVVTINAPAACCTLSDTDRASLLADGHLEAPSARTGQTLRVGSAWLREQLDDPERYDLPARCRDIACPALLIHGDADRTVPPPSVRTLADAIGPRATVCPIPGGDHVLNTPNPTPMDAEPSAPLAQALDAIGRFIRETA
ncbi:MAG: hypothetical protein DHS20C14_07260 [Phycisphaeraceae bacterium]|nr:MAG: hypothetical protein DHS20C14_07260 [Phycisphaeraceae bacterium]